MKNKIKFNFVDFVIVIAVVLIAFAGWMILGNKSSSGTGKDFTYEILFREVTKEVAESVQEGADIFDGVKIINIGTISDVSYKECTKYQINTLTGEYVNVNVPDRYDLTVKVAASGNCDDMSCFVNEYEIFVGKRVDAKSVGFVGHGNITTVVEGE